MHVYILDMKNISIKILKYIKKFNYGKIIFKVFNPYFLKDSVHLYPSRHFKFKEGLQIIFLFVPAIFLILPTIYILPLYPIKLK